MSTVSFRRAEIVKYSVRPHFVTTAIRPQKGLQFPGLLTAFRLLVNVPCRGNTDLT